MNGWILENFKGGNKPIINKEYENNGVSANTRDYSEVMKEQEEAKEAARLVRKATKNGMTIEEVKKAEAEKAAERARIAKIRRYAKELEEMKGRMAYMEKWLAENA